MQRMAVPLELQVAERLQVLISSHFSKHSVTILGLRVVTPAGLKPG